LILTTLIWRNARALHRSDAKRKQVEEALRRAYDDLELRVTQRTVELSKVNETLRAEVIEHKKSETARGQLLRQLVTAQEEERRRISRELHDQMGQHLNALMLGLKNLSASCGNGGSPHKNSFHRLQELTEQLMEKTWGCKPRFRIMWRNGQRAAGSQLIFTPTGWISSGCLRRSKRPSTG